MTVPKFLPDTATWVTRGEYAWNYLYAHQDRAMDSTDPRCLESSVGRRLLSVVDRWLQEITPGAHVGLEEVRDADAVIAGFSFDRPGDVASRRYRATNVGFGLSYTLPVLLALLAPEGLAVSDSRIPRPICTPEVRPGWLSLPSALLWLASRLLRRRTAITSWTEFE